MKRYLRRCGALSLLSFAMYSHAQSLGDLARQERARKSDSPRSAHLYTNEDFSKETAPPPQSVQPNNAKRADPQPVRRELSSKADQLRDRIRAQKQRVHELESRIAAMRKRLDERESIGTVTVNQWVLMMGNTNPGVCLASSAMTSHPYKDWCEEPAKLSAEMERDMTELRQARAVLEALQEYVRQMGYGNAVYDPD